MSAGPVTSLLSCFRRPKKTPLLFTVFLHLPLLCPSCFLQEWFKHRNEQWRKAEGLPAKHGSVLDWRLCWMPEALSGPPFLLDKLNPPPVDLSFCIYEAIWTSCMLCEGVCVAANITAMFTEINILLLWVETTRVCFEAALLDACGSKFTEEAGLHNGGMEFREGGWGVWGQCAFVFRLCLHLCLSAGSGAGRREYKRCKEGLRS